ncbi:MAG TPA: hypothetical protein VF473_10195 [Cyclobacteriaceae bacterium]
MESKATGAYEAYYKRQRENEAFKKWILDNNIQPLSRDEFEREMIILAERRRKYLEEQARKNSDAPPPSNTAA